MKPRIGSLVCVKHGGNHPNHKKKAKERLLELVDPALAELHRVLTDKAADDSVKVRAALGILDRTGHGPGAKITVGVSKWDEMFDSGDVITVDRSLPAPSPNELERATWEDYQQAATDAQAQAWAELDAEDEEPYRTRLDPYDANTVQGQVLLPEPPDTRDAPSEHDPLTWPYQREPS